MVLSSTPFYSDIDHCKRVFDFSLKGNKSENLIEYQNILKSPFYEQKQKIGAMKNIIRVEYKIEILFSLKDQSSFLLSEK